MSDQDLKRHPIRGGIWGIPTGLGLGLLAVNSQIFSLSLTTLAVFAVLGIAIGAVWASFGPAKKPKGAAPVAPAVEPVPVPMAAPIEEAAVGSDESDPSGAVNPAAPDGGETKL